MYLKVPLIIPLQVIGLLFLHKQGYYENSDVKFIFFIFQVITYVIFCNLAFDILDNPINCCTFANDFKDKVNKLYLGKQYMGQIKVVKVENAKQMNA